MQLCGLQIPRWGLQFFLSHEFVLFCLHTRVPEGTITLVNRLLGIVFWATTSERICRFARRSPRRTDRRTGWWSCEAGAACGGMIHLCSGFLREIPCREYHRWACSVLGASLKPLVAQGRPRERAFIYTRTGCEGVIDRIVRLETKVYSAVFRAKVATDLSSVFRLLV